MNIHEQLLQEGIRVNSQQEQQKVICPQCSHTRRKNRNEPCLSLNLQNDVAKHINNLKFPIFIVDNISENFL